jgi:hypothetical protein
MAEREVTEEQVEVALRRPMGAPDPGNRPDTLVIRSPFGGRRLKVVVDSVDTERVISVMWEGGR